LAAIEKVRSGHAFSGSDGRGASRRLCRKATIHCWSDVNFRVVLIGGDTEFGRIIVNVGAESFEKRPVSDHDVVGAPTSCRNNTRSVGSIWVVRHHIDADVVGGVPDVNALILDNATRLHFPRERRKVSSDTVG